MQHLWQLLQNKMKTKLIMVSLWKTKWINKSKQLSNTCEMFKASFGVSSLPMDSSQTFRRNSSEFMGKLIKDHIVSRPKYRQQILYVESLALYRRTISDRTFTNWLIKGPDALSKFLFILRKNLSPVALDKCARWILNLPNFVKAYQTSKRPSSCLEAGQIFVRREIWQIC